MGGCGGGSGGFETLGDRKDMRAVKHALVVVVVVAIVQLQQDLVYLLGE